MMIFDDTYEHEAGNLSTKGDRVLLLIDIWHPELEKGERDAIQDMFQVVKDMVKERQNAKQ